jgi:hypothetical protein
MNPKTKLHFTLSLTGVVSPFGDVEGDDPTAEPMTLDQLRDHLYYAVNSVIIGNGLITGDTNGTLDYHDIDVTAVEVKPAPPRHDDADLSADELEQKYNPAGGGEHPDFPREDWQEMVRIEDTLLGYWAWVHHSLTSEEDDPE